MGYLGNPEVRKFRSPHAIDQNVVGLDVTMNYPLPMRVFESRRDLKQYLRPRVQRQLPVPQQPREAGAVHVLEDEVVHSLLDTPVENTDDVGMVEGFEGKKLPVEAGESFQTGGELLL